MINKQILLKHRPQGAVRESDFSLHVAETASLAPWQFLVQNLYLSMEAGFRKWMNEGTDDKYPPGMTLGAPVKSIVLGRVIESRHTEYPVGAIVSGRKSWENFSVFNDTDFVQKIYHDSSLPLHEFAATLGPSGMTAYFGLLDIGKPKAGDTVLVSAAGGAVGSIVGQIAKIMGCRTIGITSSAEKCLWLKECLGYDGALNHQDPAGLAIQIQRELPEGFDIYFDNVGGKMLDTALLHMKQGTRIVLCGAISEYDQMDQASGMFHIWELVVKRATAAGFYFSDFAAEFPAAVRQLTDWIKQGKLHSVVETYEGIEQTPKAFCDMLSGKSRGKCIVKL